MIRLKTKEEIEIMKMGGKKLREVVKELIPQIKVGMTTNEIDVKAEELIRAKGAEPSFKRVKGYHWSTCLTVNEEIVHTPPSEKILKNGDILTVDIGIYYKGFNTDFADTIGIGKIEEKSGLFLKTGKKTLISAINKAKAGERLGSISDSIQKDIESAGYLDRPLKKTLIIKPGLVIAIEVIYAMGRGDMKDEANNWSISTVDKSLSACFEHTVAVTDTNTLILT